MLYFKVDKATHACRKADQAMANKKAFFAIYSYSTPVAYIYISPVQRQKREQCAYALAICHIINIQKNVLQGQAIDDIAIYHWYYENNIHTIIHTIMLYNAYVSHHAV